MDTTFLIYIAVNIILIIFGITFLYLSQKGKDAKCLKIAQIIVFTNLFVNCICFYFWGKENHLFDLRWEDVVTMKNELANLNEEDLLEIKEKLLTIFELF